MIYTLRKLLFNRSLAGICDFARPNLSQEMGEMNYRPDEWSGYHCGELCIECDTNPVDCNKHYEAGADAMLEGLKNKSSSIPIENYCEYYGSTPISGKWVFIPEEVESEETDI